MFGDGHAVGERAEVVAAERGPERVGVLHHEGRRGLVAGIGLPLLLPHRHRPAGGPGVDRLVIPVGALHEPHPHGRAAVFRPGGERGQIMGSFVEVALHHDPAVRPLAKLLLHRDLLEDGEGEVFAGMALHVDVNLRVRVAGEPPERPQPGEHASGGARGVDGIKPAVERGELERHVHPRQRGWPAVGGGSVIDERVVGPACGLRRQFGEQPRVGGRVGVGLGVARDRLAEEVEREAAVVAAFGEGGPGGFGGSGAGDEPTGLGEHRGANGPGGQRREQAGAGRLKRHADGGGQPLDHVVVDVFAEVSVDRGGVVEHRHAVDEPEEPHLEIVVGRGPFAGLLGPVFRREHRRPGGTGGRQEVAADGLHAGLDPLAVDGRETAGQEGRGAVGSGGGRLVKRGGHGVSPFDASLSTAGICVAGAAGQARQESGWARLALGLRRSPGMSRFAVRRRPLGRIGFNDAGHRRPAALCITRP